MDITWLIRRLKAMSGPEVMWRISQKELQLLEGIRFRFRKVPVTKKVFSNRLISLRPDSAKLCISYADHSYSADTSIHLLGGASYDEYRMKWNAGFQTGNTWPDSFSYKLNYRNRDDIGDARTNWELNRHFQFPLLAKAYKVTGDNKYISELLELMDDWNAKNAFLHGISWTSVMEVAIRCSNWCYTYAFLEESKVTGEILEDLRKGILNMTDYIIRHYSRFSSANNHLIVEAFAIGQSGILFDNSEWTDLAISILTEELTLQNYDDGVNKELSLHYQSFYMEAMGLIMRLLKKNGISYPGIWDDMLSKMCRYLSDCRGSLGETVEFGDNDEGKILDLCGGDALRHYEYILGMFSILLEERYIDLKEDTCENLLWLFTKEEIAEAQKKPPYRSPQYSSYTEGGVSILRSSDKKVLIGVDHGALGFGSIAAHGHADALSFQLYSCGQPVFIDPGTYIYHCDLDSRNRFRKTCNHNTVTIDGKDQSEMLGPFLWGRKANASLLRSKEKGSGIELVMEQDGYLPVMHTRTIRFDGKRTLDVEDVLSEVVSATATFILSPDVKALIKGGLVELYRGGDKIGQLSCENWKALRLDGFQCSEQYGIRKATSGIVIEFEKKCLAKIVLFTE